MMSAGTQSVPLALKFEDWPEQDVHAWMQARGKTSWFDDDGAFAEWSEGTEKLHRQHYGHWLAYLKLKHPDLLALAPCDRITQAMVGSYIDYAATRANTRTARKASGSAAQTQLRPRTIAEHIVSLTVVAKGLGPDRDWSWLSRAARRLHAQSNPYQLKPPLPLSAQEIMAWSLARLEKLHETVPGTRCVMRWNSGRRSPSAC